jgi:hypothetical protein
MNFKLVKKSSTKALTTFQVVDDAGDIKGTINVPVSAEDDLLKCWSGGSSDKRKEPVAHMTDTLVAAAKRSARPPDKKAILRGG